MKFLALMPIAAAAVSVSLDADLNAMRESLRGIASAAQKDGKQINQTTINVVAAMLTQINRTLVDALHEDKSSAQKTLTDALNMVETCATMRSATFDTVINTNEVLWETAHDNFIACKNGEAGSDNRPSTLVQKKRHGNRADGNRDVRTPDHDYGYNFSRTWHTDGTLGDTSHEVHAHSEEYRLCKLLNDTVKGFKTAVSGFSGEHPQTNHSHYCEDPIDPNNWTDVFRTNQKLVDETFAWFSALDAFENASAAIYKERRENCHLARHRHVLRVQECTRLQHLAEGAYCTWSNSIDEECYLYSTCYDTTWSTWNMTNASAQDLEDQMRRQQEALECLLCYGNEIMKGNTDLSRCDAPPNDTCQKCDDYALNYTEPHDKIDCTEAREEKPCDLDWITSYMEDFPDSSHPLDECQVCQNATLVAWS